MTRNLTVNPTRIAGDIDGLAAITEPDRPWTRRAFTPTFLKGREWLTARFEAAGLRTHIDAAGNLIGSRAGSALLQRGWQVAAVRRDVSRLPTGFTPIAADYTVDGGLDCAAALAPDFVVTTFNPFERSVAGYERGFVAGMRNLLAGLGGHRPRHILMASSTRVYAETQGGWVDELSPLTQGDAWARAIIGAEQLLLDSGLNASVVRFAGRAEPH